MKLKHILFVAGLVLFVVAFFLPGVNTGSTTGFVHGWLCAWITLAFPWGHDGITTLHDQPLRYFAMLFSGWINPLFLIICVLLWTKLRRLTNVLTAVLILMLPLCWVVFHYEHVSPMVGYYVWAASILLVVFSRKIGDAAAAGAAS
jgi:hypothetical protein